MIRPSVSENEKRRVQALRDLGLLGSDKEERFDRLTRLAAQMFNVPVAYISLLDENHQWFKSSVGMDLKQTGRDVSFCSHTILSDEPLIIPDATLDARFRDNPMVKGPPHVRFYAGMPLATVDNLKIGTFCLADFRARVFQESEIRLLQDVADLARDEINSVGNQQVAEQLRVGELRFLRAFEHAAIGMGLISPEGRWLTVNQALCDLTGYSGVELRTKSFQDLCHPQDLKEDKATLRRLIGNKSKSEQREKRLICKDGQTLWVMFSVSLLRDPQDNPLHFILQFQDISALRKADDSLRLFRALLDKSNDAIEVLDPLTGRFLDFNETAMRRLGYTREELLALSIQEVAKDDVSEKSLPLMVKELKTLGPKIIEGAQYRKDGSKFPVEVNVRHVEFDRDYLVAIVRDVTDRKETEFALRISEERYRTTLDNILEGCQLIGFDWRYLYINHEAAVQNRRSSQEMLGETMMDMWPGIESTEVFGLLRRCMDQRVSVHKEIEFNFPDGHHGWFDLRSQAVPEGIFIMSLEITERKRAETDQMRLAEIIKFSDDAIISKTLQGIVSSWNSGAEKIFGYSAAEAIGRPISFLFPPERANEEAVILAKIVKGESVKHFETVRVRKDGKRIDISVAQSPIFDSQGKIVGASKIARDITDRKKSEHRIAEQAALLDKANDAIMVRGLGGEVQFWNKGAEKIYGWNASEAIGKNVGELLYPDPNNFVEINAQTVEKGEWTGEVKQLRKNRDELIVEVRWTLIRDQEGNPKSILAINSDITEKKKIEAQFMRAQRMESIGTLAGGVAHDLNNILAPIMMSITLLKRLSVDATAQSILATIEVSAKRGADIVRQVLSFARGMDGERVEIQPKHLLNDVESIIKDTFPKDIRLSFSEAQDIWTILGDATQIHQILLNLSVNARDAMPSGGRLNITVENCQLDENYATIHLHAKAGRYVNISVTDSGSGMPPHIIDKIFEPFFTTKEPGKGTGLGLSTVLAIVKSHGGFVNVYSELGKGTTFKIYLPATKHSGTEMLAKSREVLASRGNGEMILVVDDEASVLTITSQTLQAFGYRVVSATEGASAIAIYAQKKDQISVVLTDMMMPVMDGVATIHSLRRINPEVRVIAASGLNANGTASAAAIGVKYLLTKPYTAESLLITIQSVLKSG